MKLYALDVGVYARAPLLSHLVQYTSSGKCVVTQVVLQVFRRRLQASIQYFIENHRSIKQNLQTLLPRHGRKQSAHQILKLLESIRQGREDVLLYTVLRATQTLSSRKSTGSLLEKLLSLLEETRHVMGLLDTLYYWLHANSSGGYMHPLVASIEHLLNHYLEGSMNCDVGVGSDYTMLIQDATRLAKELQLKDIEDIVMLLSLCSLNRGITKTVDNIILLTTDHKMKNVLIELSNYVKCLAKTSIHVIH